MRVFSALVLAMALAACASGGGGAGNNDPQVDSGPSPFPVQRGTAMPPPAPSTARAAPPEGRAAGGIDFGQWRQADPATYAPAFQTQIRARYTEQSAAQVRADLEANGFACEDGQKLDCRIEIMERQCAYDWYVVIDRQAPVAGFDQMCLGAR